MEKLMQLFCHHPAESGESYFQHLCFTLKLGASFAALAVIILAHGLFPFLFCHASSKRMQDITQRLAARNTP